MSTLAILLAGGSGTRMGRPINKVLIPLGGKTLLQRSMEAFAGLADRMVLVHREEDRGAIEALLRGFDPGFPVQMATGGPTRQDSVRNGVACANPRPDDLLLIHDSARCLVDGALIRRVMDAAKRDGAAIPGIPVTDTIKQCDPEGTIIATPDRAALRAVQTPQGFRAALYLQASALAEAEGYLGTDDASLLEHAGIPVRVVPGSPRNMKITTEDDLHIAEMHLKDDIKEMKDEMEALSRVGSGYDVHRLVPGRKLILCGEEIPFELGLLGHSDADVALHALMDAMLGAAALGDIGQHFPDTDPRYSGISSLKLLGETDRLLREAGYRVVNADITIAAQKPKLAERIPAMRGNIAGALGIGMDQISVKATTTEHLGFEGRMEGISAYAVCLIVRG